MMARAGAQETENAPSAVRPDKRLPRCTGGKTFCRPFISYFFPPQRLWVDNSRFRSEEHTSELQSLMRISYDVFCLKKKKHSKEIKTISDNKTISSHISNNNIKLITNNIYIIN